MKNINEIKSLIKKICSEDSVFVDHDLNVTILDSELREKLKGLTFDLNFYQMNRVVGYFIEEVEGNGLNMENDKMDDSELYLNFCLNECYMAIEDLKDYVNIFKENNY